MAQSNNNNGSRAKTQTQESTRGFVNFIPRNMIHIGRPAGSQRPPEMKTELVKQMFVNPFVGLDHEDSYNHLTKFYGLVGTMRIVEENCMEIR
ncbi:hypothetical protein Lal_00014161 [Lupinus albus]|nr:hypothetical protein Lal_00014161 [Lupinus albus]